MAAKVASEQLNSTALSAIDFRRWSLARISDVGSYPRIK